MRSTNATVAAVASAWSEQTRTSASIGVVSCSISDAGRWWKAAETRASGSAAWRVAAIEPRGGIRARNSFPSLTRALTIETTTLPESAAASGVTVATSPSHGVATTTNSAEAASSLDAPLIGQGAVAPRIDESGGHTGGPLLRHGIR